MSPRNPLNITAHIKGYAFEISYF